MINSLLISFIICSHFRQMRLRYFPSYIHQFTVNIDCNAIHEEKITFICHDDIARFPNLGIIFNMS